MNFEVKDLKTVGSEFISLSQLNDMDEHQRVSVQVMVVKVHEPQKAGSKKKQDVLVADSSGRAVITLWEADINSLHTYSLNPYLQMKMKNTCCTQSQSWLQKSWRLFITV